MSERSYHGATSRSKPRPMPPLWIIRVLFDMWDLIVRGHKQVFNDRSPGHHCQLANVIICMSVQLLLISVHSAPRTSKLFGIYIHISVKSKLNSFLPSANIEGNWCHYYFLLLTTCSGSVGKEYRSPWIEGSNRLFWPIQRICNNLCLFSCDINGEMYYLE